jgi:putative acetyltransferase
MSSQNHLPALDGIVLRAVEPDDFAAIQAIYAQPLACLNTMQMPFPSKRLWQQRLAEDSASRYSLVACMEDWPVGNIGLFASEHPRQRHMGSLGMGVHDEYAGRGIGELLMRSALEIADNWLRLTRIELTVYADNERAIRLYERTGFEVEGLLRRYATRQGELAHALMMARLR